MFKRRIEREYQENRYTISTVRGIPGLYIFNKFKIKHVTDGLTISSSAIMTVDLSRYEELLRQFGGISDNHIRGEALDNLKEKYKDEIHSTRVLEAIVSVSSLLQVLKKRGVLQYNDINALRDINNEYLKNAPIKEQLGNLITEYSEWLNEYSDSVKFLYNSAVVPGHSSTQEAPGQSQLNMPFFMTSTTAGYSTQSTFFANHTQYFSTSTGLPVNREHELRQLVVRELSKQIGHSWALVCRKLDISENTIYQITRQYLQEPREQKCAKMFKEGMRIYFSEPRPQWKGKLLNALREAGRSNLEKKIQEIILNHPNN